jgi:hypothetical protein
VSVEITLGPKASPTVAPKAVRMPAVVISEACLVVVMRSAPPGSLVVLLLAAALVSES